MNNTAKYRSEALKLYRDILRSSKLFTWRDAKGVPWSQILRQNARKEFEAARVERDPLIITRLLVVGREALDKTMEKVHSAHRKIAENIDKTRVP